jgi:hypothetical protein
MPSMKIMVKNKTPHKGANSMFRIASGMTLKKQKRLIS